MVVVAVAVETVVAVEAVFEVVDAVDAVDAVAGEAVVVLVVDEAGNNGTTLHMMARMPTMEEHGTTVVVESWPREREDGRERHLLEEDFVNMDGIPSLCLYLAGLSHWDRGSNISVVAIAVTV